MNQIIDYQKIFFIKKFTSVKDIKKFYKIKNINSSHKSFKKDISLLKLKRYDIDNLINLIQSKKIYDGVIIGMKDIILFDCNEVF